MNCVLCCFFFGFPNSVDFFIGTLFKVRCMLLTCFPLSEEYSKIYETKKITCWQWVLTFLNSSTKTTNRATQALLRKPLLFTFMIIWVEVLLARLHCYPNTAKVGLISRCIPKKSEHNKWDFRSTPTRYHWTKSLQKIKPHRSYTLTRCSKKICTKLYLQFSKMRCPF